MKTCTGCNETKSLDEFLNDPKGKYGKKSRCKPCTARQKREYKHTIRAEQARRRRYYIKHKEKIVDYQKKYYEKNRTQLLEYRKAYNKRRYNEKKIELVEKAEYYSKNAERRKLANHKRRVIKNNNGVCHVKREEIRALRMKPCVGCGITRDISIDHIVPISRGGRHAIGNLQPLCGRCNRQKSNSFMIEWKYRQLKGRA